MPVSGEHGQIGQKRTCKMDRIGGAVIGFRCMFCSAQMLLLAASFVACESAPAVEVSLPKPSFQRPVATSSLDAEGRPRVIVLGDSLTAGLGLSVEESYPAQLQVLADAEGHLVRFVAHGVSGDTTAGGLNRLEWALGQDKEDTPIRVVVIALGGNDGLRGLPVDQMHKNLEAIITRLREREIQIVLVGMEAPPNFGEEYTSQFREVFRTLGSAQDVVFVPFLLEGVAGVPDLNQRDHIHPNAAGSRRVAEHLWTALEPLLVMVGSDGDLAP